MLVEDDNNLREIYEARLLAEGYDIVSAPDGEAALAMAVKEKPDLIISDVMMPKISGFDMLDILRSTPETKNTKVIMMTALSAAEDKSRAERLGADRYLVKSQVTLEDVAKVAREVLDGEVNPSDQTGIVSEVAASTAPAAIVDSPVVIPSATAQPILATPTVPTNTAIPNIAPVIEPVPTLPVTPPSTSSPSTAVSDNIATAPTDNNAPLASPIKVSTPTSVPAADDQPPASVKIDDSLTQTTASEEAQIENQINEFVEKTTGGNPQTNNSESSVQAVTPDAANDTVSELDGNVPSGLGQPPVEETQQISVVEEPKNNQGDGIISPEVQAASSAVPNEPPVELPTPGGPERQQSDDAPIAHKKIIQPLSDLTIKPDLNELLAKEEQASDVINSLPKATTSDNFSVTPPPSGAQGSGIDPNSIAL